MTQVKKITTYYFDKSLHNPVGYIQTAEEGDKLVTKKGAFTVKTYRQNNKMEIINTTKDFQEALEVHKKEIGEK